MKNLVIIFFVICLTACQSGALLNSEADIIEVTLPEDIRQFTGEPLITNNAVSIPETAISDSDREILSEHLHSLALQFKLTPGATISDVDTPRDFTIPQQYTVVSQDKKWTKTYTISFFTANFNMNYFEFSNYELVDSKYYQFYEILDNIRHNVWASGNPGFAITAATATADDYPTSVTQNGKSGTAAKLVTRSTGAWGEIMKMPIAAGNLFLGNFILANVTTKPLEATQFGVQTTQNMPVKLGFWCKYKPGAEYKNADGNILQQEDSPSIYAVLYEAATDTNGNPVKLDGTNVQTDPSIVCIAIMSDEQAAAVKVNNIDTDDYIYVEVPFVERNSFDTGKQAAGKYYFTIVFSSSTHGDLFEGAIGSTLLIDDVQIFSN
ncbi:MAG: PCMD domain-containing protein [Paludibacter sp.]|nr:PCMD domain-containing protein [Paludibacter sp.]